MKLSEIRLTPEEIWNSTVKVVKRWHDQPMPGDEQFEEFRKEQEEAIADAQLQKFIKLGGCILHPDQAPYSKLSPTTRWFYDAGWRRVILLSEME